MIHTNILTQLRYDLALVMPGFMGWIEGQNSQNMLETPKNIAISGLAIYDGLEALGRILGWVENSS